MLINEPSADKLKNMLAFVRTAHSAKLAVNGPMTN